MSRFTISSWLALLTLWLAPSLSAAAQSARVFPGGAATDNIVSASTVTPTQQMCIFYRFNITTLDVTTRRLFDWSNGTIIVHGIITDNSGAFHLVDGTFATTPGQWTIAALSTGAEHNLLHCFDTGSVSNNPVVYVDGATVTATPVIAPAGAMTLTAQQVTIGNRQDLTRPFPGTVSTVAIWTNTLLDATAATNLHNGMPPCLVSPANLILYYPLDGGLSPEPELMNGNNGTVTATTVGTGPTTTYAQHCSTSGLMGVGR